MASVFINELHYDNDGADTGEFVEIAGVAGTTLTGWSLVFYNGSAASLAPYETVALSGLLADTANGWGFLTVDVAGIQNGSPDGLALVDDAGAVVEFLSYEGTFTAASGPAEGLTATDIGVFEPFDAPAGVSLQRTGTGADGADFAFAGPAPQTRGAGNAGQTFTAPDVGTPFVESFEGEPGATYTLSGAFDNGSFNFFGRFSVPDTANAARDDFQLGWDGLFGIIGQNFGTGDAATRTVTLADIDISGFDDPAVAVALGALASEPGFQNYEAADGDGIAIYATVDGGTRTLVGAFAPDDAAGDLRLDANLDGVGDGARLTTTLERFVFALPGAGDSLTLEIELRSTGSFEPIALDRVEVNEADAFVSPEPAASLVIAEFMPNPDAVADAAGEYFEIVNTGDTAVDLEGYTVSDAGGQAFTVTGSTVVEAGETLVFGANGDPAANGGVPVDVVFAGGFVLANGDDEIILRDANGTLVDEVVYDATWPFAAGVAAELIDLGSDNAVSTAWTGATATYGAGDRGTPGAAAGEALPVDAAIAEIQGGGHLSPFVSNLNVAAFVRGNSGGATGAVVRTTGVVTALTTEGFFIQDAPDGDEDTSDAIFVRYAGATAVAVGDAVTVTGAVREEVNAPRELPQTTLNGSTVEVTSQGNALPAAVGISGVIPSEDYDNDGFAAFERGDDGLDFYEALEGMLVTVSGAAVTGTNRFGEVNLVGEGNTAAGELSDRGTLNISPDDFNPEKVQLSADWRFGGDTGVDVPLVDTGARLSATGVITYDFGNYQVLPTAVVVDAESALEPEATALVGGADTLSVATYNVLNLDINEADGDTDVADGRLAAVAEQIVSALGTPDVVALQEVQDNNGAVNDGVVAADATLQALVDAIVAAGGPRYAFIDNPFIADDASGGEPGGNIRTAMLYDPSRVSLVEGSVRTTGSQAEGGAFENSRLPLAADFLFNGQTVTVVDNHFSSKGGSAPISGIEQPFEDLQEDETVNGSLEERRRQTQAVNDFVDGVLAEDPEANVVVLGDLNEFEFVSPLDILAGTAVSTEDGFGFAASGEAAVLSNLIETLPEEERYSFIFQGNSQELDHILVSDALVDGAEVDIVHVNTEFAATAASASDHDPVVALLDLPAPEPETVEVAVAFALGRLLFTTATETVDGAVVDTDRLLPVARSPLEFGDAGIVLDADGPGVVSFFDLIDGALGIRSVPGRGGRSGLVDDGEVLGLSVENEAFGDAVAATLAVSAVRGNGRVRVELFDDGASLGAFNGRIREGELTVADADGATFDRVEIGARGNDGFSLERVGFQVLEDTAIV